MNKQKNVAGVILIVLSFAMLAITIYFFAYKWQATIPKGDVITSFALLMSSPIIATISYILIGGVKGTKKILH